MLIFRFIFVLVTVFVTSRTPSPSSPTPAIGQTAEAAKSPIRPSSQWTVLFYGAANNSCEETIMDDIAEMKQGFVDGQGVELILLVDRIKGFSKDSASLGEDFEDSRLYRITHEHAERLDGAPEMPEITLTSTFDANMGDAATLRQFVRYAKAHFPAEHYALVFYSHGDGRAMCADNDSGADELFPAEITEVLEEKDSVDLLGFDVCSMGGIENLYQWRPGTGRFHADAVVASASVSGPWPYAPILARLCEQSAHDASGSTRTAPDTTSDRADSPSAQRSERQAALDSARRPALDLAQSIVAEKHAELLAMDPRSQAETSFESWAAYDLTRVADLKRAIDALAIALAQGDFKQSIEGLRGSGDGPLSMNYMVDGESCWTSMPYFDVFELARRIERNAQLPDAVRERARAVAAATDAVVAGSFGMARYTGFESGRHGLFLIFPDGDARDGLVGRAWRRFRWYTPLDASERKGAYGRYAFCSDGASAANRVVENWFELMDRWFDESDESDGGLNAYDW